MIKMYSITIKARTPHLAFTANFRSTFVKPTEVYKKDEHRSKRNMHIFSLKLVHFHIFIT